MDRAVFVLAALGVLRTRYFSAPITPAPRWSAVWACAAATALFSAFMWAVVHWGLNPAQRDTIATVSTAWNADPRLRELAARGPAPVLDERLGITPDAVEHLLRLAGALGIVYLKLVSLADMLFPVFYTLLHRALLSILFPAADGLVSRVVHCFPWLAMLADYLENVCIAAIYLAYPEAASSNIVTLANRWNLTKWAWQFLIIGFELVGLFRHFVLAKSNVKEEAEAEKKKAE